MVSDMRESHGPRPFEPYRTLQLHPHAPRQLIVAAYWRLVERWKTRASSQGDAEQALTELNAAYELLSDPERRRAYDAEHGLAALSPPRIRISRGRRGLLGLGSPRAAEATSGYYHLLRVDHEADDEVIGLAHSLLSGQLASRSAEDRLLRQLFDEARRTLCNPQLRAQYDASLQAAPPDAPAPPASSAPLPAEQGEPLEPALTSIDAGPAIEAAAVPPDVATPVPPMFRRNGATVAPESDGGEPAAGPSVEPGNAVAEAAVDVARPAHLPGGLLRRARPGPPPAAQPHLPAARDVDAARDERLLALRDAGDAPAPVEPAAGRLPQDGAEGALAELVFVAGPFTGSRVPLGKQALTLGSSPAADLVLPGPGGRVAPEHARIWQHGDRFVFRQLEGACTEISGRPLLLSLVMLEDGDDIQMGPHRMRFSVSPCRDLV